jgi:hypothetical protein
MKFQRGSLFRGDLPILAAIVAVALGLRSWGVSFGLPYVFHYDEHFYVNNALNLGAGVIGQPPYVPIGLSTLLFGEYAAYFVFGKLLGLFSSPQGFEAVIRADPTFVYLLGRLTSALFGAATVVTLYFLGKRAAGSSTGLAAAGVLAVSFLHVRDSHYSVPDIAMSFFVVLVVALVARGVHGENRRCVHAAALCGGVAVAMKWTALPVATVVWWAAALAGGTSSNRVASRVVNRTVVESVFLFILGFILSSPQILANPAPYWNRALGQLGAGQGGGFEIWQVDTLPGWLFYGKTLLHGVGAVVLVCGIVGIVRRLVLVVRTGDRWSVLLLLFPLTYYLLMGLTRHYFARYVLPLVPFVALFAGEVVARIGAWFASRRVGQARVAMGAVVLIAVAQPAVQSIRHDTLVTREDTRVLAKEWIEAHLEAGSKIATDWPIHGPPLATDQVLVPGWTRTYDVTTMGGCGLSDHTIDWYCEQGFDYLVTTSYIYRIPLVVEAREVERQVFYASMERELDLVQAFYPNERGAEPAFVFDEIYGPIIGLWERTRPGPVIKIYGMGGCESR